MENEYIFKSQGGNRKFIALGLVYSFGGIKTWPQKCVRWCTLIDIDLTDWNEIEHTGKLKITKINHLTNVHRKRMKNVKFIRCDGQMLYDGKMHHDHALPDFYQKDIDEKNIYIYSSEDSNVHSDDFNRYYKLALKQLEI